MAGIYEWLEGVDQPMDGVITDDPMDQITLLDLDQDGNMYFDMPHAWNPSIEQRQTYDEHAAIDPSLSCYGKSPGTGAR